MAKVTCQECGNTFDADENDQDIRCPECGNTDNLFWGSLEEDNDEDVEDEEGITEDEPTEEEWEKGEST